MEYTCIKNRLKAIGLGEKCVSPTDVLIFRVVINSFQNLYSITNDDEIIYVFKGTVICEKYFGSCGFATPASRIYDEIRQRGLDPNYALADWAFQYSNNEYIPFGFIRHGEKTAYEYIQWREDLYARIAQEQLDAQNRKAYQLKRAQEISEKKRQTDALAHNLYQKIMCLSPDEQIQYIVNDSAHYILFYMPVIHDLMSRTDVLQQDWNVLLHCLSQLKVTPFNKRLIKNITSKLHNE